MSSSFNYTEQLKELIRHITETLPDFSHIDCERILVGYTPSRVNGLRGMLAKITPLRYEKGSLTVKRGRYTYQMPEINFKGQEILYVIHICMPKFLDLPFEVKLETILHELYHISPEFNGDIRRFPGAKYAHGFSRKKYQQEMVKLREEYLSMCNGYKPYLFLQYNHEELEKKFGFVTGTRYRLPKPFLVK